MFGMEKAETVSDTYLLIPIIGNKKACVFYKNEGVKNNLLPAKIKKGFYL